MCATNWTMMMQRAEQMNADANGQDDARLFYGDNSNQNLITRVS